MLQKEDFYFVQLADPQLGFNYDFINGGFTGGLVWDVEKKLLKR